MRGRPRKPLDVSRIATLRAAKLSNREIAEQLKVSRTTLWRCFKNNVSKIPPAPVSPKPTGNTPVRMPELELGELHHLLFTVAYEGKRPPSLNETTYGNNGSCHASIFEFGPDQLQIHAHRIEVWTRKITGDTSGELHARARGRCRRVLGEFAQKNAITVLWPTLEKKADMHIIFTEAHQDADKLVLGAVRERPERAKSELGILPGDRSHPNQCEFIEQKGQASFDALSFAIKQMPVLAAGFSEYNQNIKKHLAVLGEMSRTMKAIRKDLRRRST